MQQLLAQQKSRVRKGFLLGKFGLLQVLQHSLFLVLW